MTAPTLVLPTPSAPASPAPRATLGARLGQRDNALNFVRLILASTVMVDHAIPLGGFGPSPAVSDTTLGRVAVTGFFAASGYLVAGSRDRLGFVPYMWRRALRLYPAFWVALAMVAFVFAPLSTLVAGTWSLRPAVGYVAHNATLWLNRGGVAGTLEAVPYPRAWNGSLWTLVYEFSAYVVLGLLFMARPLRKPIPLAALLLATMAAQVWTPHVPGALGWLIPDASYLASFFLAGTLLWSVRARIPATWPVVVLGAITTALALVSPQFLLIGPIPFALLVLSLGAVLPVRIGSVNDVSYGMYIYAFPIQQMLSVVGISQRVGPTVAALIALAVTTPFAWASWLLIEKPASRLKTLLSRTKGATTGRVALKA